MDSNYLNDKIKEEPQINKVPCHDGNYNMAFILVETSDKPAKQEQIEEINFIKSGFSKRFSEMTLGRGTMDTDYPVFIFTSHNESYSKENVTTEFYNKNPDDFEFISIYTTYWKPGGMNHRNVKNNIKGIGFGIWNLSAKMGSSGKLIGVSSLGTLNMRRDNFATERKLNGIMHETAHSWGAYITFVNESGDKSNILRNSHGLYHWDKKLNSSYDTLGGFLWKDNGDGTFTALHNENQKSIYSDLTLYLMGFMPPEEVKPMNLIISDADSRKIAPYDIIEGELITITVDQIIAAEGERYCVENN